MNYLDNDLYLGYDYLDLELNKDCDKQLIVSKAVSIHFGITGVYFLIHLIFGNKIKFSSVEKNHSIQFEAFAQKPDETLDSVDDNSQQKRRNSVKSVKIPKEKTMTISYKYYQSLLKLVYKKTNILNYRMYKPISVRFMGDRKHKSLSFVNILRSPKLKYTKSSNELRRIQNKTIIDKKNCFRKLSLSKQIESIKLPVIQENYDKENIDYDYLFVRELNKNLKIDMNRQYKYQIEDIMSKKRKPLKLIYSQNNQLFCECFTKN